MGSGKNSQSEMIKERSDSSSNASTSSYDGPEEDIPQEEAIAMLWEDLQKCQTKYKSLLKKRKEDQDLLVSLTSELQVLKTETNKTQEALLEEKEKTKSLTSIVEKLTEDLASSQLERDLLQNEVDCLSREKKGKEKAQDDARPPQKSNPRYAFIYGKSKPKQHNGAGTSKGSEQSMIENLKLDLDIALKKNEFLEKELDDACDARDLSYKLLSTSNMERHLAVGKNIEMEILVERLMSGAANCKDVVKHKFETENKNSVVSFEDTTLPKTNEVTSTTPKDFFPSFRKKSKPESRPVYHCTYCSRKGHIARFCYDRLRDLSNPSGPVRVWGPKEKSVLQDGMKKDSLNWVSKDKANVWRQAPCNGEGMMSWNPNPKNSWKRNQQNTRKNQSSQNGKTQYRGLRRANPTARQQMSLIQNPSTYYGRKPWNPDTAKARVFQEGRLRR